MIGHRAQNVVLMYVYDCNVCMYVVQISCYNRYLSQTGDTLYILFRCCTSGGDRDVSNCTCDSASLCVRVPRVVSM